MAFKLLKRANITKEEKLLVLTGMNYESKDTLYEEAIKSLKKFKGESNGVAGKSTSIKLEQSFLAANEEILLAAGYVRSNGSGPNRGGSRGAWRGSWAAANQRGGYTAASQRGGYTRSTTTNQRGVPTNRTGQTIPIKNINPTGQDGRIITCKRVVLIDIYCLHVPIAGKICQKFT